MVEKFLLPKKAERIIVLQRVHLVSPFIKRLRKLFGRYIFSNIITKFFLNSDDIATKYFYEMSKELSTIKKYINENDSLFLSIGGGIGGLEALINKKITALGFEFIKDKDGTYPAVRQLSEIAGNASILIASEIMSITNQGNGLMLGKI